jgi:hypothetical protein
VRDSCVLAGAEAAYAESAQQLGKLALLSRLSHP